MSANGHDIYPRAFAFSCRVIRLYRTICEETRIWQPLAVQCLKAGTSMTANLEEANAGQTKADFIFKCCVARKEASEVRFWLRVFSECTIGPRTQVEPLLDEADQFVAMLTTIVRNARRSPNRG